MVFGKMQTTNSILPGILRRRAVEQPDQIAYVFLHDGEATSSTLTYRQLDWRARVIATRLRSLGSPFSRCLLLYPPGLDFIAAFFGCLYSGMIAVPLSLPRPRAAESMSRLKMVAADAGASLVLTTTSMSSIMENLQAELSRGELASMGLLTTDSLEDEGSEAWEDLALRGEDIALLQYTSGSTTAPKGTIVSHLNLVAGSEYLKQAFELTTDSISVTWLPSFHDMGLVDGIIQPLYTGFRGIVMPPASFLQRPFRWLEAISRYGATHCGAPNFAYDLCVAKAKPDQLSSWIWLLGVLPTTVPSQSAETRYSDSPRPSDRAASGQNSCILLRAS